MTLNPEQKAAVEHKNSPLLIVAGPGSGKTFVIIQRILHLIKNGTNPSEILCLTFTKKAAGEMLERLENEGVEVLNDQVVEFEILFWDPAVELAL